MAALAAFSKTRRYYLLSQSLLTLFTSNPRIPPSHNPPSLNPPSPSRSRSLSSNPIMGDRIVQELLAAVEREKQVEREERRKKGLEPLDDEGEDYMGVGPLIERLERRKGRDSENVEQFWEDSDSDSDEDDERYAAEELQRSKEVFEKKCKRHGELLKSFAEAGMD